MSTNDRSQAQNISKEKKKQCENNKIQSAQRDVSNYKIIEKSFPSLGIL